MKRIVSGLTVLLLAACATPAQEAAPVRPLSGAEMAMGYQDAVQLGAEYIARQGFSDAELQAAERVAPNVWCVRFGLAPKGSGRTLELYFDGQRRTLIKHQETGGLA